MSAIISEVCKLFRVQKSRTTPYHPQSDGLVERFNRTLLDMLAITVTDRLFEWEQHLPRLCHPYNTSIHPKTGSSPFFLMFGRQAPMPVDIMLRTATPTPTTVPPYVVNLETVSRLLTSMCRVRHEKYTPCDAKRKKDVSYGQLFQACWPSSAEHTTTSLSGTTAPG